MSEGGASYKFRSKASTDVNVDRDNQRMNVGLGRATWWWRGLRAIGIGVVVWLTTSSIGGSYTFNGGYGVYSYDCGVGCYLPWHSPSHIDVLPDGWHGRLRSPFIVDWQVVWLARKQVGLWFQAPLWMGVSIIFVCRGIWLLRAEFQRERRRRLCLCECGYCLRGNVSGRCPECGAQVDEDRLAQESRQS